MSDYMKLCHIAITAGGTTIYELCACGIPSIMYTIADNQLNMAKTFDELGLIPWVGDIREDRTQCVKKITLHIEEYVNNLQKMEKVSRGMQAVVDGNGCNRIAVRLKELLN